MPTGPVKWFDARRGFGFIIHGDGPDVFVHFSVIEGTGFRALKDGETVEYESTNGPKGLLATSVKRIPASPAVASPPALPQQVDGDAALPAPPQSASVIVEDPDDSIGNRLGPGESPTHPDAALRKIILSAVPAKIRPNKPKQ